MFPIIFLACAVIFQVFVTLRVLRTDLYESEQKRGQAFLIWLLPIIGAAIAFWVLHDAEQV